MIYSVCLVLLSIYLELITQNRHKMRHFLALSTLLYSDLRLHFMYVINILNVINCVINITTTYQSGADSVKNK